MPDRLSTSDKLNPWACRLPVQRIDRLANRHIHPFPGGLNTTAGGKNLPFWLSASRLALSQRCFSAGVSSRTNSLRSSFCHFQSSHLISGARQHGCLVDELVDAGQVLAR